MLTKEERDSYFNHYIDLPKKVAYQMKGYELSIEDMEQEGMLGLLKALDKFNEDKLNEGEDPLKFFGVYAYGWIKSKIFDYVVRNSRIANMVTTKNQRKLFFNLKKESKSGNWFNPEEVKTIAKKYDVREEDVLTMELRMSPLGKEHQYMHTTVMDEHYKEFDYNEFLKSDCDTEKELEEKEYKELLGKIINEKLDTLPERNKKIIEERFLNDNKKTLETLASEYNISAERVRQIEKFTLNKLKKSLLDYV